MEIRINKQEIKIDGVPEGIPLTVEVLKLIHALQDANVVQLVVDDNTTLMTKLRIEKGISKSKMAELLGISRASFINIENKKTSPSVDTAIKVAKLLGTRVEDIF